MPLDFSNPHGERTLGRSGVRHERERWPRHMIIYGLHLMGGYERGDVYRDKSVSKIRDFRKGYEYDDVLAEQKLNEKNNVLYEATKWLKANKAADYKLYNWTESKSNNTNSPELIEREAHEAMNKLGIDVDTASRMAKQFAETLNSVSLSEDE